MQFQVPQFIETEDKIVGPFTLRQFIYLVLGGLICAGLFFLVQLLIWIMIAMIIMGISGTLAFGKVNGQPMTKVLFSSLTYYWKPQVYVWQPNKSNTSREEAAEQSGFSLQNIVAGAALKGTFRELQTGSKSAFDKGKFSMHQMEERYEILHRLSGEQRAARRIDYR